MTGWYQAFFVERWPWWIGGPAIGLFVLGFFFFQNRLLGASSTFQAVMEALRRRGRGDEPDFQALRSGLALPPDTRGEEGWRAWFWLGLFLGGLISGFLAHTLGQPALAGLGEFLKLSWLGQIVVLFFGGILIGSGTRASGGCTSGHAITGISSLQGASLAATAVFFAVAMAVTFALQWWRG
jgi:uncharacterized membrane protein YedE/YeeE